MSFPFPKISISDSIRAKFESNPRIKIAELAVNSEADLLGYNLSSVQLDKISTCIYIGQDDQSFFNLNISLHGKCSTGKHLYRAN